MEDMRRTKMQISTKVEIVTWLGDSYSYMNYQDKLTALINDRIASIYARNYKYLDGCNFRCFRTVYEPDDVMILKPIDDSVVEIISVDIIPTVNSDNNKVMITGKITYRDSIPVSVKID